MLYQLVEAQRAALQPLQMAAEMARSMLAAPNLWPETSLARHAGASSELFLRLTKRYSKPAWNIEGIEPVVAHEKPFCKLMRFAGGKRGQPKVLLVAPLSGHHATLLRDTVQSLVADHDVWVSDWVDAALVPPGVGPFHLADYVYYVRDWIRRLSPDLHVISVCQPTVPVLAAVSLMASAGEKLPRALVMMGGPIDARRSPTAVNNLATHHSHDWFEQHLIHSVPAGFPGCLRRVYPGFLQHMGFVAMNPQRHMDAHWDYYQALMSGADEDAQQHRRFYDEYNAVLDLPAEYYLDTIREVFQKFSLAEGQMQICGDPVRPQDIRGTALLTIEGEKDDISGNGQTQAAHDLCAAIERRAHYTAPKAGHYGIFSGRRWRQDIYPRLRDFIAGA
jgi:poly(3-hydroxybutyrate) depolymerase